MNPRFSIVVLTFNRPHELRRCVGELQPLAEQGGGELVIVDNCSETDLSDDFSDVAALKFIRLHSNIGVGARNIGIAEASAPLIITLDDDVGGLTAEHIALLERLLADEPALGAINFRVLDRDTGEQINWSHHLAMAEWANQRFQTYEISEGAVAFRRSAFNETRGYPDYYFISHEGPDLAIQLMNAGYQVIYTPEVAVLHSHAPEGRPSWRRYYFDTRNTVLFAIRALPVGMAIPFVVVQGGAMLIYSIRDGFTLYCLKGLYSALTLTPRAFRDRFGMNPDVRDAVRAMRKREPSFLGKARRRLNQKRLRI